MNVSVMNDMFLEALKRVSPAVDGTAPNLSMRNVLLATDGDMLCVAAGNGQISIRTHIGAKVNVEGSVPLPFATLKDIISVFQRGARTDMILDGETRNLLLVNGTDRTTMRSAADVGTPALMEEPTQAAMTIPGGVFARLARQAAVACARESSRPVLEGVHLCVTGHSIVMEGTDGYRMVRVEELLPEGAPDMSLNVIVPESAILAAAALASDSPAVELTQVDDLLSMRVGHTLVTTRLIEGRFPDVSKAIPTRFSTTIEIVAKDFLDAVKRASLFTRTSSLNARLLVEPGAAYPAYPLTVVGRSDVGSGETELDAQVSGDILQIAFKCEYLLDIAALGWQRITLRLNGDKDPMMVTTDLDIACYVIMPMRAM